MQVQPETESQSPTFAEYWNETVTMGEYLNLVEAKADLWRSHAGRAKVHEEERARLTALAELPGGARKVMILTDDWCGDAIRSTPTIAAMGEAAPGLEVRVLDVEQHPAALDGRLTCGARAIPIVIVFDEAGAEIGAWGPRPAPLQAVLRAKIRDEGPPTPETMGEFYAPIMGWYAKDQGRTVAQEMLMLLERG